MNLNQLIHQAADLQDMLVSQKAIVRERQAQIASKQAILADEVAKRDDLTVQYRDAKMAIKDLLMVE